VGFAHWFAVDAALDDEIRRRFEPLWQAARLGKLDSWQDTPEGALALILVLDQFPRNMFRGHADSFVTDAKARESADRAIAAGFDMRVPVLLRPFFYMPLMHAEDLAQQDRCIALFQQRLGPDTYNLPFARAHRAEIEQFGRFPARNSALGRKSTDAETAYLKSVAHH
jgi:uncharacterized protein (DUF924 family)